MALIESTTYGKKGHDYESNFIPDERLQDLISEPKKLPTTNPESWVIIDGVLVIAPTDNYPKWLQVVYDRRDENGYTDIA